MCIQLGEDKLLYVLFINHQIWIWIFNKDKDLIYGDWVIEMPFLDVNWKDKVSMVEAHVRLKILLMYEIKGRIEMGQMPSN